MSINVGITFALTHLPKCPLCEKGEMLPLVDYPQTTAGANIAFYTKGWACNGCDNNIIFKNGDILRLKVHE